MFDFKRLREESKTPDYVLPKRDFVLQPRYDEVIGILDRIEKMDTVAWDVETDTNNHMTAISFAISPWSAISIPFTIHQGAPYWTLEEEVEIWKRLKIILENERISKYAQNAQFDMIIHRVNPLHIKVSSMVHLDGW